MRFVLFLSIIGGMTLFHHYYKKDTIDEIIEKNNKKIKTILEELEKHHKKNV